ncbi:hypothetical protein QBC38DRAFT_442550 [Podospora fimiseda]|uniref:Uncharacterized protein n=1 Tax=Podospora fimiseda TaxID=252190 RepID=A0AAN7BRZ9_9PEZI|nr:hypothetical protein QBC38DRAFT_442550 [Podospora fimiseda]
MSSSTSVDPRLAAARTLIERKGTLNGGQLTEKLPNASLSASNLTTALTTIKEGWALAPEPLIRITPLGSVIEYIVAPADIIKSPETKVLGEYITMEIRVCTSAFPALDAMTDNLSHWESLFSPDDPASPNPQSVRLSPGQKLGDFALWTSSSVLWVLGNAYFVTITRRINNPTSRGSTPQPPGPGSRVMTIATDLNRYLENELVDDSAKQDKPSPTLSSAKPITVKQWGVFTVQVGKVKEAHPIRAGEDPKGLVVLVRPGTMDGKFEFQALDKVGESTITLRFANENTLVFSELKVDVKVIQ